MTEITDLAEVLTMNALEDAQRLLDSTEDLRETMRRETVDEGGVWPMDTTADAAFLRDFESLEDRLAAAKPADYEQVLAEARKLHAAETERYSERKRKRVERKALKEQRHKKMESEMQRLQAALKQREASNAEMFKLFSDLQAVSNDFKLGLSCPELVVVGMQSDGKSTFVESLLGFTFNVVSSNIGTRRPLVIQMINSKGHAEPLCRFRNEHSDAFDAPVAVPQLAAEISRRTNDVAGSDGTRVSAKPIILRVEFARCANLTIYDTPGIRLGGDRKLSDDIRAMVLDLISPPDRIICALEQSTVEWANSIMRPIVTHVDPQLKRTILIATKFDNRVKELRTHDEAVQYLRAGGQPAGARVFFLSLPVERHAAPAELHDLIEMRYISDYEHLIAIGVDDKDIMGAVGFFNLKAHLERELAGRYQLAFMPTLERLERIVQDSARQLSALAAAADESDAHKLRAKAAAYVRALCQTVQQLLSGSAAGEPAAHGQTLAEERRARPDVLWEAHDSQYPIENASRRLYGASQFHRLLNEFAFIAHSVELGATSIDEVAAALGSHPSHNMPSYESAACDCVRFKSKAALLPILQHAVARAQWILTRLFDVAVAVLQREDFSVAVVQSCEPFMHALRSTYSAYVDQLARQCLAALTADVESLTQVVDLDVQAQQQPVAAAADEDTRARVLRIMARAAVPVVPLSREVDDAMHGAFVRTCERLFAAIRGTFVTLARNKLSSHMLKPMFTCMADSVTEAFRALPADKLNAAFESGAQSVAAQRKEMERRLASATALRDDFRRAGQRIAALGGAEQ